MAKKRKSSLFRFLFKMVLLLLGLIVLFMIATAFFPEIFFPESSASVSLSESAGDTVNIVLLGFDRSAARESEGTLFRPDTILIAAVNPRSASVSMVSIPRDSYVLIHDQDLYDKINHSYMYGYYSVTEQEDRHQAGINKTLQTIQEFLGGVPVHGYLIVDMDGAAEIVDSVGGIYIDVEDQFRGNYGRGAVQIEQGYQLLNGKQVLQYTRNRADYLGGERGRTVRQQKTLIALFRKIFTPSGITGVPGLVRAVQANIETDLSPVKLAALSLLGFRVDSTSITTRVFSGEGRLSARNGQNIYYLVIDEAERIEIIEAVFGVTVALRSRPELPGPIVTEPEPEHLPEVDIIPDLVPEEQPETGADEPAPDLPADPEPDPDPGSEEEPSPGETGVETDQQNTGPDSGEPENDPAENLDSTGN